MINRDRLNEILNTYFNREEVNTLCFFLGIDYAQFSERTLIGRVSQLLDIVYAQDLTAQLIACVSQERPHLFTQHSQSSRSKIVSLYPAVGTIRKMKSADLYRFLSDHLSYIQLQNICVDLDVDESALAGNNKPTKARELIVYLERKERLSDLTWRLVKHVSGEKAIPKTLQVVPPKPIPKNPFPARIQQQFPGDEFLHLCDALSVNIEDIGAPDKVTNFVLYLARQNRIPELIGTLNRMRPGFLWNELAKDTKRPPARSSSLEEKMAFHLDESELHQLCFDFCMNYENLDGMNHAEQIRELIRWFAMEKRTGELITYLNIEYDFVSW